MNKTPTQFLTAFSAAVLMASCANFPKLSIDRTAQEEEKDVPVSVAQLHPPAPDDLQTAAEVTPADAPEEIRDREEILEPSIRVGTGLFVNKTADSQEGEEFPDGDVTLNFEASSLREFVRIIFEDILHENYLIDPNVDGVVTLHTTRPISREAVLPILESILQINGAALLQDRGINKIVPLGNAEGEAVSPTVSQRPMPDNVGFSVQIVPLLHVAAGEMEKILKPFMPKGSSMRIDSARNLLILSAPRYRLDQVLETVKIFDVDWLKGMSFGMFPLQYADANTLVEEVQKVIGAESETPFSGIVRLVPIERLNAILVITHNPEHLAEFRNLIDDFDLGFDGSPGRRLYVYNLKNGKAENIAGVLQELFGQTTSDTGGSETPGIQGLPPGEGNNAFTRAMELSELPPPVGAPGAGGDYPVAPEPPITDGAATTEPGVEGESQGEVTIMADQDNNAVLIMATPSDYRMIEAAIRRLDVPPRQVLINAIIAEVTLNDNLDYGVQWFLQRSNFEVGFGAPVPITASGDGLAFALFDDNLETRLFFDVLESVSSVKFISAPQIVVRDNQTASIRVGDQIPVTTRTSQSTTDPNAPIVTEVQFRDTGTLLSVTPSINAGGQVTLDISQEVSLPGTEPAVGGGGNVSIAQRTIDSTVTVETGQTVVLGGLIREARSDSKSGIPYLMDIPGLGVLFSTTSEDVNRTELIITVNTVVIENQRDAQAVTDELRMRMKHASDYEATVW